MGFFKSFCYAGRGIALAVRERNFRFHLCVTAFVIFFAAKFYELSRGDWAVLLITCGAVLSLEAVNTAIEHLCDKVSPERDSRIAAAKDVAAGAVLISAIIAVAVGVCLFWNRDAFARIFEFFSQPLRLVLLAAALAGAWGIVFLPRNKE
ncbi:MAG: diacylglycerol kinase family protein [Oscillospiraceae bacterium]